MFDLTGKIAYITGAAGLLGRKHAEAIIEYGGIVIIADYDRSAAWKTASELGSNAIPVHVDVNCKKMIEDSILDFPKIDILINNAAKDPKVKSTGGLSIETRFETMTEEFWSDGIGTILNGTFLCSQIISRRMIENGGGVILNIASDLAVVAPDQRIYHQEGVDESKQNVKPITYSVAKWGIIGMTKYLATYFAEKNIRVNSLSPGGVFVDQPSSFVDKVTNLIPMGRMGNINDYKGAIVFLCSDASSYMTGANIIIDGGRSVW